MPFCHLNLTAPKPLAPEYPTELATLGDHLRKERLDRGLLQREVAERLGVTPGTVRNWERNGTEPALRNVPPILAFLGYVPLAPDDDSLRNRLSFARRVLGLSREALGRRLGVDKTTIWGWETGRHGPIPRHLHQIQRLVASIEPAFNDDLVSRNPQDVVE